MRIAAYARVSTDRGEQDPEVQMEALRAHFATRNAEIAEFVDKISGAKARRPALDRLMDGVRAGDFDAVAIVKLDRLARSVAHLIEFAAELEAHGVDLVVRDQALDTSTPAGKLMFHVLGAVAEFERDLICERTRAGIGAVDGFSRRGNRLGRPRRMDVDVERANALLERGMNVAAVAEALDVPRTTLRRALAREDTA